MRRLTLILACLSVCAPVAAAARQDEPARTQADYRDERARALRLRQEVAEIDAEITVLERRRGALATQAGGEDRRIAAQRARLAELGAREAALTIRTARAQGLLTRVLSALQTLGRSPPPPLLTPSDKAVDTVRAAILMRAIAPTLQARARTLAVEQAELARVRRLAALNSEQLFTAESARGDRRAGIEGLIARRRSQRAVLTAEAQGAERAAAVLATRLRNLGSDTLPPDPEVTVVTTRLPGGRDRLIPPVEGAPDRRFGAGSPGWRWRAADAQARAPAAGRVAHAGPLEGWGQVVILDLGPGWRAVVSGLGRLEVSVGDRVSAGQSLGVTDGDGEIAFELRREERPVDPAPFLR